MNRNDENAVTESKMYCSFAITGQVPTFQSIYICHTCNDGDGDTTPTSYCLCQGCAEQCHEDHEGLEYIGMGPSYCDCRNLKDGCCCRIRDQSNEMALTLQWGLPNTETSPISSHTIDSVSNHTDNNTTTYTRDVYEINLFDDPEFCRRLKIQAQTLVEHSKETFWLDFQNKDSLSTLCDLELLASVIVNHHVQKYDNLLQAQTTLRKDVPSIVGGEWWVQVKSVSHPSLEEQNESSLLNTPSNGKEAVDLHYDKDETLAESFGLGCFPRLSTVTYLTDSITAPPTVIFNIRFDESSPFPSESCSMSEVMVSYPRIGKHLVFDGRLLHGAPSHYALRRYWGEEKPPCNGKGKATNDSDEVRITFLVNLWLNHKPAGVNPLPSEIREVLNGGSRLGSGGFDAGHFNETTIDQMDLASIEDLPPSLRGQIQLPFVGGADTTWTGGDDDDGSPALVVVTYPPPPPNNESTVLVRFSEDLAAYLEYIDNENSDDDGNDEE